MGIKKLVQLKHENFNSQETSLRTANSNIEIFNSDLHEIVSDLIDTMMHHSIAVGLSAPQIGYPFRVSVINLKQENSETIILINPEIASVSGKKSIKKESCMSLPHFRGSVERRDKVTCVYYDLNGERKTLEATGFLARVVMHEIDHLDGVLFVDRMEFPDRIEPVTFFNQDN